MLSSDFSWIAVAASDSEVYSGVAYVSPPLEFGFDSSLRFNDYSTITIIFYKFLCNYLY